MKISEVIARLQELRAVAGADVEVAVEASNDEYESAVLNLCNATPMERGASVLQKWVSLDSDNTEQIVTFW